jgi:hypothetical protein
MIRRLCVGAVSCGFVLSAAALAGASVTPTSCSESASAYGGTYASHYGLPPVYLSSGSGVQGQDSAFVQGGYTGPDIGHSGANLEIGGQVYAYSYLGFSQANISLQFTLNATQPYTAHGGSLSGPNGPIYGGGSGSLVPGSYTYTASESGTGSYGFDFSVIAVPEPTSFAAAGLAGWALLLGRGRRMH